MGYIPRPPNAFMLFRADFVRQEHVPGSMNAGKKGEEFAAAVRDLDSAREGSPGVWLFVRIYKRRHTHTDEEYDTLCEKQHTR